MASISRFTTTATQRSVDLWEDSIKTGSPKKLQTVSMLSQSSRLVSLQNNTTESPATSICSQHRPTERVEEFIPFCAAASSNGALPTPSCLGALPLPLGDAGRKQITSRRRTRYEDRHTGMDYVVSRIRRSHLGAMTLVYCSSLASVHSHKPASPSRVSAWCSTSLHMLFFWTFLPTVSCLILFFPASDCIFLRACPVLVLLVS